MKRWMQHTWVKIIAVALSLSLIAAAVALVLTGTTEPLRGWGDRVTALFALFSLVTDKIRQGRGLSQGGPGPAGGEQGPGAGGGPAPAGRPGGGPGHRGERPAPVPAGAPGDRAGPHLHRRLGGGPGPGQLEGEVTLDQGTDQGIQAGQCVVDEHGALVGRVKEVGASWANVTLLWDPGFQMAGQGTKSGVLGSLEGPWTCCPGESWPWPA
ncbi:MAG: rod shape-determining protein MreC [Evtepia gabavorous]